MISNDESVFPLLKPALWGQRAESSGTIAVPLYAGEDVEDRAPVLAYCVDKGETVAFIREDDLPKSVSSKSLHVKAMQNLEYALSDTGWEEVDMRDVVPGLKILVLGGNYYASEAILLQNRLKQAHTRLKCRRLLASVPVRGRLLVTEAAEADDERVAVFVAGCLNEFYGSSSDAPVSPLVWLVEDGEIIGHLEVPEEVEKGIAQRSQQEQVDWHSNIGVSNYSYPEKEGLSYCFVFDTSQQELLYEAIQSVMRDFATTHNGNGTLSGHIKIVVQVGPELATEKAVIDYDVAGLCRVLERQFEATGLRPCTTRAFRMSHEIKNRPSPDNRSGKESRDEETAPHVQTTPAETVLKRESSRLFAPGQVALACLLGTPLAGLIMLAANQYSSRKRHAISMVLLALIALPLVIAAGSVVEGGTFFSLVLFVAAAAVYTAAARDFISGAYASVVERTTTEFASVTTVALPAVALAAAGTHSLFAFA